MTPTAPNFGFLVADTARLLRRDFDRRARNTGLSRAQWSVLARLARHEGLKQAELADLLEMQPISLARHIDRLEARGCVERRADANDRRANRLFLTATAGPLMQQLQLLGQQTRAQAMNGIADEHQQLLCQVLDQIRDNLAQCGQVTQENLS